MNPTQQIAHKRMHEIAAAGVRIERKIKDMPDDQRVPRWKARLAEYSVSVKALALTLKSGVEIKVKDAKQQALLAAMTDDEEMPQPTAGVAVDVPAGELIAEGK